MIELAAGPGRITRWLRFRLTVSYVLFFGLVFAASGLLFRGILRSIQNDQVRALLEEEWAALRGYLSIERKDGQTVARWDYRREDPGQSLIVERLRSLYLIADDSGQILEASPRYRSIGIESAADIRARVEANEVRFDFRRGRAGRPYLIRSGLVIDSKRRYYVTIGTSLDQYEAILAQFSWYYLASLPVAVLGCALLGWFVSKRALTPVTDLARQTEAISGSNLSLRISSRGAGDELDDLISTFNKMVERLEQSFNQTRQFSTDVSHELRTPLTVIRGQLEVALLTASSEDQYREAILKALDDVERLSNTVRALLQLSQAESGQLALNRTDLTPAQSSAGSPISSRCSPSPTGSASISTSTPGRRRSSPTASSWNASSRTF
jgi:signal transduction histidine kinase